MPAQIDRSSIVRGPGSVTLDGVQMFDRDMIKATPTVETFDVRNSAYGLLDTRRKDSRMVISFRPDGAITTNILAKLFPYGNPTLGSSLMGATDKAAVVHSLAGKKFTFHSAALTKMPGLKLSVGETAFASAAEITAVVKNNTPRTDANSIYTVADEAWAGSFDVTNIKGGVYVGTWGSGQNALPIQTQDGWDVEFDLGLKPQVCDGVGTYDFLLESVGVRAKCKPLDLDEEDLLDYLSLQGASAGLGSSMLSGKDLVIAAAGALTVTIKEAAFVQGGLQWGSGELRVDEIGFQAHRDVSGGTPGQIFSVALTA